MELDTSLDELENSTLGDDVEFEVSTPRLTTPFYEALKKKYPQAFKRRTSLSSQASDTVSVCSDSSFSSAYVLSSTVKRPRPLVPTTTVNQNASRGEGLPPLPPGGRSRKQSENNDFSIVGSPRRGRLKRLAAIAAKNAAEKSQGTPPYMDGERLNGEIEGETDENHHPPSFVSNLIKNGEQYGSINSLRSELILPDYNDSDRPGKLQKGGDLYSSSRSLQLTENAGVLRNRLYKTDSTQSLKDKLKQNHDSWKKLLSTNNSPFKEIKPKLKSRDTKSKKQDKVIHSARSEMSEKNPLMNNVMRTLEDIQNRITFQADLAKRKRVQNLSRSHTPNNELAEENQFLPVLTKTQINGVHGDIPDSAGAHMVNINRHEAKKRLQSPDSQDSAVELDSLSMQSSPPVSDVTRSNTSQMRQQTKRQNLLNNGDTSHRNEDIQRDPVDLRINLNFLQDSESENASPRRKHKIPSPKTDYSHESGKSTHGAKVSHSKESGSNFVSNAFLKLDANEEEELIRERLNGRSSSDANNRDTHKDDIKAEMADRLSTKSQSPKTQASRDSDDSGFDGRTPQSPKKYSQVASHDPVKRQNSEDYSETSSDRNVAVTQSSSRLHKLRSRQRSQETKPSTPLRADHSIVTPRGDSFEKDTLPTRPHSALKDPISSSKDPSKISRPRSASLDSRKNRVVFEDEVNSDDSSKPMMHRAGSQPILHGTTDLDGATGAQGIVGNNSQRRFHSDQDLSSNIEAGGANKLINNRENETETVSRLQKEMDVKKVKGSNRNATTDTQNKIGTPPVIPTPKQSQGTPHKVQKLQKQKDSSTGGGSLKLRIANTSLRRASVSSTDNDVNEEVAMITSALEETSDGRPKLPWKKSKGRYTPSEEVEKVQMQAVRNVSQKSHWSNLYMASKANQKADDIASANKIESNSLNSANESEGNKTPPMKPPRNKKAARLKGNKQEEVERRKPKGKGDYEDVDGYQEVGKVGPRSTPQREQRSEVERPRSGVRKTQTEGGYQDIGFYQEERQDLTPRQDELNAQQHTEVDAVYAAVQKRQSRSRTKTPNVPPAFADSYDDEEDEEIYTRPPVPERGYESNLKSSKELSGSRSSLMDSFKDSAKKKFGRLRRALSMERISGSETTQETASPDKMKKAPSLKSLFGKKKSGSYEIGSPQIEVTQPELRSSSMSAMNRVEQPKHYRKLGRILSVSPDGTQIIELMKPPHGPFGFFIARGKAKYNHGIFVSRLGDGLPEHFFAGLLGIGDEILEINKLPLQKMALDDIYDLMGKNDKLTLKILPFVSRKDS